MKVRKHKIDVDVFEKGGVLFQLDLEHFREAHSWECREEKKSCP